MCIRDSIRPLIAVLAARALGYESDKVATCATFVEFIHTASLLHDDVVDESCLLYTSWKVR